MTTCQQPICRIVTCPVTDSIPYYNGNYSLQNGTFFANNEIVIPVSYGNGSYYVPANTILINVPSNPVTIQYQGCVSGISLPVPSGSTPAQVAALVSQAMQQVAQQLAICNAPTPTNAYNPESNPNAPAVFWNTPKTLGCPAGNYMILVGALPPVITFLPNGAGISIPAGLFASNASQFDADLQASTFLTEVLTGGEVQCVACNLTPSTLPNFAYNTAYSQQLLLNGNIVSGWTMTGTFPTGITMDTNGLISGTPTDLCHAATNFTALIKTCSISYSVGYTPKAVSWADLLWQTSSSNGGNDNPPPPPPPIPPATFSFTPNGTTSDSFSAALATPLFSCTTCGWFLTNLATLTYCSTVPINCKLVATYTETLYEGAVSSMDAYVDGFPALFNTGDLAIYILSHPSPFEIDFTLPATGGVPLTFHLNTSLQVKDSQAGFVNSSKTMGGTFSTV